MAKKNSKALQTKKFHFENSIKQAHIALENNCMEEAIYYFNTALNIKPGDTKICNNLGVLFYRLGNYKLSKLYLEYAIQHDTEYFDAIFNLVKVYQNWMIRIMPFFI